MFPSSLNTKRRAACAAKGKNNQKSSLSHQEDIIIEESSNNISHIGSFLKKRSNPSSFSSNQSKPAVQAVNQKKFKKIFKDLPSVPKDTQFLIIDSDSEVSTSEEAYLQDSSSSSHSFDTLKGLTAQINCKTQDTFLTNGYQKIQNADRHSFSLEASSSEGSTTASSEFKVEEESEIQESSYGYKKLKKESDSSFRYCPRKDSMLSTSSDTQVWYGSNDKSNYFDDHYPCGSALSSNLPTPNFTSCTPQTNQVYLNSSNQKIDNSCFLLDDADTNLPTRKNSVAESQKKEIFQSSPRKDEESKCRSNCFSSQKEQLLSLENLQYHQLQHQQIKIDAELAASQAKEQEEKTQKMIKLIEQGRKLVEQRMGRLAAENQVINGFPCCTFTVRCFLKHTFVINVEDLLAGTWCNKCEENLLKAKEYAEENKGVLLSQLYGKTLKFKCSKNHCWESSHQTYRQRWCSQCKKIVKDQFKQYIKEEEAKKQAEYQKNQEEMYKEARRKAMISQSSSEANPNSEDYKKKVILAAKQVEREVEKIAEQQARDYIKNEQKDSESPCNFSQLKEMFKIILFPDSILQVYYINLDAEILKSEYRNIARFIHPDKNSHPRAAESFQKLNNFYTLAQPKA